ncbi:hypothetical protein J1C67_16945 [Clostridium gasigenes]|uniref:hypothetical protein n=1 Tax=Clostridium gasigenes TaxID=94869 RepID=UPI0014384856|nr:hypothetical protein [Clostridium gasigenes]NKF06078.1 hypothetical protein [Clostridium gasigenes]QSW19200.1 hypothetical protein J1C67_16945 [Clostridium gasigenes]
MRIERRYKRRFRRGFRRNLMPSYRHYRKPPIRINNLTSLIGSIIVLIGILIVFKNTMIYSGLGFSRGITLGTPCGVAFILLMIGIIIILCNKNSFAGWALVSIGIIWFFIGILMNFRMVFMPINLLKAIMLFGFIAVGIAIIIRGVFCKRR